jgi:hypothetical protein
VTSELESANLAGLALQVEKHFASEGYTVTQNQALWTDAPLISYSMTKGSEVVLVELRQRPELPEYLQAFVLESVTRGEPARLFVAIEESGDDEEGPRISVAALRRLRELGVGLMVFATDRGTVIEAAVPFSLRCTAPPTLRRDRTITGIVDKFNRGQPVDAVRDLVVLVEGEVTGLAMRAARAGQLSRSEAQVMQMDLNGLIDLITTSSYGGRAQRELGDQNLRADLHSIRTGRNLVQHAPRTPQDAARRDRQLKDRIELGFRLVEELRAVVVP